jgi:hypothetical protein
MPNLVTPLADVQVKNAKPKDKAYKLFDGGGLYLEIMPTGSKLWRMKFRQANGKEGRLSFGNYPEISLTAARAKRSEARQMKAKDINPGEAKRLEKRQKAAASSNTFEAIARQWHANRLDAWKENTAREAINRLEKDVFPLIGKRPVTKIDAPIMMYCGALKIAEREKSRRGMEDFRKWGHRAACSKRTYIEKIPFNPRRF